MPQPRSQVENEAEFQNAVSLSMIFIRATTLGTAPKIGESSVEEACFANRRAVKWLN